LEPSTQLKEEEMYFVYIIQNEADQIYVGYTSDLERRLGQHNRGENASTRGRHWRYIYYEAFLSESDARQRERKLKQRGQSKRHLLERIAASRQISF
jgi:putative endonuclease